MSTSTVKHLGIWGVLALMVSLFPLELTAQGFRPWHNRHRRAWPDSLHLVTLQGVVLIDSTDDQCRYFLDVNGDSVADYKLAFGPNWYQPSSGAVRPAAGDTVTIVGLVQKHPVIPTVIVFKINGLDWRPAVENWWQHRDWPDSLQVVTVSGTVLVDSTYFYVHYYLDEDGDGEPDYFLDFGPPWYQPSSGAERPEDGATVTIEGGLKEDSTPPRLIVYTINGLYWRNPAGPPPWAGRWVRRDARDTVRVHCPTDSLSWFDIPPGAMHGGGQHGGPNFPDSIFCEFLQMFGDSLPGHPDSVLAGFQFYFSNPAGHHVRGPGKAVRFIKRLRMSFHYGEPDTGMGLFAKRFSGNEVVLKYWDANAGKWIAMEGTTIDYVNQIVYVEPESVETYYAVFQTTPVSALIESEKKAPVTFSLSQNYPNPFNPVTEIHYQMTAVSPTFVTLKVYNLMGQEVRTLVQQVQPPGSYRVTWNGRDNAGRLVPSGVYLYRLQVGEQVQVRRMLLLK
ncbi:MAG: T9SS type A sorting domain-containing protein [candidate division KSB1 bacterium]|nr:T9SS type A sorting domain-containing protein [candidate division KSB1 bacterium]